MKVYLFIALIAALAVASFAQETAPDSLASDSLAPKGILFNGVVLDSSFAEGEKLYVLYRDDRFCVVEKNDEVMDVLNQKGQ